MITTINEWRIHNKNNLIKEGSMSYWPSQYYDDSIADTFGAELTPAIDNFVNDKLQGYFNNVDNSWHGSKFWHNQFCITMALVCMQKGFRLWNEVLNHVKTLLEENLENVPQDDFLHDNGEEYITIMSYVQKRVLELEDGYCPNFLNDKDSGRIEIEKQLGYFSPTDQPLSLMSDRSVTETIHFVSVQNDVIDNDKLQRYATAIAIICNGEYGDVFYNPDQIKIFVCLGDANPFSEDLEYFMKDAVAIDYKQSDKISVEIENEVGCPNEPGWFKWTGNEWIECPPDKI